MPGDALGLFEIGWDFMGFLGIFVGFCRLFGIGWDFMEFLGFFGIL